MVDLGGGPAILAADQAAVAGRAFVGKHHLIDTLQQRHQHQDRRINRGDRDVAVPGALPVEVEQLRRKRATDVERRHAGAFGAGLDQLGAADPAHRLLDAQCAQGLDADQRVLATSDRHQRVRAQPERGHRCRFIVNGGCAGRGKTDPSVQVHSIAVGEFAQPVQIGELDQFRSGWIYRITVDGDRPRDRGLVVAHSGNQMEQPQRLLHGSGAGTVKHERCAGHGDGFHQFGTVVEGVHQPGDTGRGIEIAAHEAECGDRITLERPVVHSMMSSAGKARRL